RPTLIVTFGLIGLEPFSDPTGFRIAHTHEGDSVAFDEAGRASLELHEYLEPLYIKIFFPDGTESVRYLDGGMPAPGEVHELEVGGGRTLEIDLRIVPELLDEVAASDAVVVASYRAPNGDATIVGRTVDGPCVVTVPAIHSDAVSVAFETVEDGSPIQWANERVTMTGEDRVAVTLLVESAPTTLRVLGSGGDLVTGFSCDIRMIPDDTTCVRGGVSDEHGEMPVPRVRDRACALCGYVELDGREVVAIDAPVDLDPVGDSSLFRLDPLATTYVEVLLDGEPLQGVAVDLVGTRTRFPYFKYSTGEDGRTRPLEILESSQVTAVLLLDDYWCLTPQFPLSMKRNSVAVSATGTLVVSSDTVLDRVRSITHGAALSDWAIAGVVQPAANAPGRSEYRVPVGEYDVASIDGEVRRILVSKGSVTRTGL
ncbi:MAG: hypothetical protein AAGI22_24465, partial [Planctomycetota bacterium]